jgi:DNA repair protein RadD
MQLRPRQAVFVDRCKTALKEHGNTIGVATVGFGKTIALSAIAASYPRSLVLQHRIELLEQNRSKFQRVAPEATTATFAADHKRWAADGHTFAMVQSLGTKASIPLMKPVDLIVIDEAHHASAASYLRIIEQAKELNPDTHILGVTATPERGDGKGLRAVFSNVADIVSLGEMVQSGFLVRPRTFVIDLGMRDQLGSLKKSGSDFDMDAAAALMDIEPVTERVIQEWFDLAKDRKTIGFATNVAHAKHMTEAFKGAGVAVECVDGTTPNAVRRAIWRRFKTGETQMVWNCAVATEGFDEPSVSCVILNRPSMHKGTMIQMIGRGLRTISEPDQYPGLIKDDCIIIDLGSSLLNHGGLEVDAVIDSRQAKPGEAPTKECPKCDTIIPMGCRTCPACAHQFLTEDRDGRALVGDFVLTEIDLLEMSPYRWEALWDNQVVIADGLSAAAILVNYAGIWWTYGVVKGERNIRLLNRSHDKIMALANGDDFLRTHGDKSAAKKSKRWLNERASEKQCQLLGINPMSFSAPNRYKAACMLTWKFNERKIQSSITAHAN